MTVRWQVFAGKSKRFFCAACAFVALGLGAGCSTNPATGNRQFTALMSPTQENQVGAQEHDKIIKSYGLYEDKELQAYVSGIGARVTRQTERPDVTYKFFILDSPIVNAFALPGGYVYVSRGLLALANSEAELAAVLAHEVGHVTARHSAERYSHGVVTSLGASVLSAVIGNSAASQALNVGSNLYLSSYSRGQENEADALGLRYMAQGGYDAKAMPAFLESLNAEKELDVKETGQTPVNSYFSTHPPTPERVSKTRAGAANYPLPQPINGRDTYLRQIDGMVYGDSAKQGFEKGGVFYHPDIGFSFKLPQGYRLINQPQQIALKSKTSDAVALFDFAKVPAPDLAGDPLAYLRDGWMKGEPLQHLEAIKINGLKAATALFSGKVNGTPSTIRLVAVLWQDGQYARFQVALPEGLGDDELTALKKFTYSLRRMGDQERSTIKPPHIDVVSAKAGDRLPSFIQRLAFSDDAEAKFRILNAMDAQERLVAGRSYKLVVND